MKKFGSLILAAILGSGITIAVNKWMDKGAYQNVKIEHVNGVPSAQVAYRVNEKGEAVALDFTGTAEKVTQAVVHIKSSQTSNSVSRERNSNEFNAAVSSMKMGASFKRPNA